MITSGGSKSVTNEPSTGIRESQKIPPAPEERAADDHRSGPCADEELRGDPRGDRDREGGREVRSPGSGLGEAEHVLHVERDEEEHRVEAGHRDHLCDVGGRQPRDPEDGEGEERLLVAQLVDGEGGEDDRGARELEQRPRRAPADVGRLDDRVDEQQRSARREQGA
jgi:hypothetical protein